jgi:ABC-type phosphate/phosphonate transport system permease subunit
MTTTAMVITAVIFCAIVGIPLGIIAARSDSLKLVFDLLWRNADFRRLSTCTDVSCLV